MQKNIKVNMQIRNNPLTSQNSSPTPIAMSLSKVIFNLVSSLANNWTTSFKNLTMKTWDMPISLLNICVLVNKLALFEQNSESITH